MAIATTPRGVPYPEPGSGEPNNPPIHLKQQAEWVDENVPKTADLADPETEAGALLAGSFAGKPTIDADDLAILMRDRTVANGVSWTTPHETIARVLGWAVVTDARYGGGADNTGVDDSAAAVQAAHDSLPTSGGTVWFPAGTFKVGTAITVTKPCAIRGTGPRTKIQTTSATANIFTVSAGQVTIGHVAMSATVTRTAGWYVDVLSTASNFRIEHFTTAGAIGGVRTAATSAAIAHGSIRDGTAGTGIAVRVDGGFAVAVEDITTDAAAQTYAGIYVTNVGDLVIKDCQLLHAGTGLLVQPGAGQSVTSLWAESTFFDNCTTGVSLSAAGGAIARSSFLRCWMGSATNWGVLMATSGAGTIDGTDFLGCHIFLNGSGGIAINAAAVSNTRIANCAICDNTGDAGILVNGAVSGLSITDNLIGAGFGLGGNGYGIFFNVTTVNDLIITDNDLTGNTIAAIAGEPTSGTNRLIANNLGDTSRGATAGITVGASPFTYTAGSRYETVYINAGTVSLVKVDGASVFQQTNCAVRLAPGKSVEVTYTVAPGMSRTKD